MGESACDRVLTGRKLPALFSESPPTVLVLCRSGPRHFHSAQFACLELLQVLQEAMVPEGMVSDRFNLPDADVTFRSSDQVIFRVHLRNLETHSDGFPPSAISPGSGEVVDLSEPAATLDLLFQYIYPQRQPDLTEIELPLLSDLAEAVEKYQVYSAMDICKIFMGNGLQDNPLTVLNYAVRHGYPDIADEAAPLTISLPLEEVGMHMHQMYMGSWLRYYGEWQKILELAYAEGWRIGHTSTCRISNSTTCPHWLAARQNVLIKLGARPGVLNDLAMIFTTAHGLYPCAIESLRQWEYFIVVKVKDIPKFRTFL